MAKQSTQTFTPLNIAVLTVSDTRSQSTDTSGQFLVNRVIDAGHRLVERIICTDDIYQIRAKTSQWIADQRTQCILINGGTGFSSRDSTPEAIVPILDKQVEGFGELFRQLSYQEIGTSTVQSRALAGLANKTLIFCLPGSTNACETAWHGIIHQQLDSRNQPCNFAGHLKTVE